MRAVHFLKFVFPSIHTSPTLVTLAGYCTCSTQYPVQYQIYFCPPTEFLGNSIFFQPIDGVLNGKMSISTSGFAKKIVKKALIAGWLWSFTFSILLPHLIFHPLTDPLSHLPLHIRYVGCSLWPGWPPPMHPQPLPPHFYFFVAIADHVSTNFCQEWSH